MLCNVTATLFYIFQEHSTCTPVLQESVLSSSCSYCQKQKGDHWKKWKLYFRARCAQGRVSTQRKSSTYIFEGWIVIAVRGEKIVGRVTVKNVSMLLVLHNLGGWCKNMYGNETGNFYSIIWGLKLILKGTTKCNNFDIPICTVKPSLNL